MTEITSAGSEISGSKQKREATRLASAALLAAFPLGGNIKVCLLHVGPDDDDAEIRHVAQISLSSV